MIARIKYSLFTQIFSTRHMTENACNIGLHLHASTLYEKYSAFCNIVWTLQCRPFNQPMNKFQSN